MTKDVPIRDAATLILVREADTSPQVLMGQRGASAAFMPDKYVFPGGAVDPGDAMIAPLSPLTTPSVERLKTHSTDLEPATFASAALRELMEETGQCIGRPASWDAPEAWRAFAERGLRPDHAPLHFFFRALTPPGRPRRFDARFFLADAASLATDPDDFSQAEAELSHLHWVPLGDVRALNLPFITQVVLGELERHLPRLDAPDAVPFVQNEEESRVIWL